MSEPYNIAIITGSPSKSSRTSGLAALVEKRLASFGFRTRTIHVRELPAEALLHAKADDKDLADALTAVAHADGVVITSPTYKAAYTGVLKAFIDLFPQFGLRGKVVLPFLTGGTLAHVLALDYGLKPVLQSLDPKQTVAGLFFLDKWLSVDEQGGVTIDAEVTPRFEAAVGAFVEGVRALVTEEPS
jgi:FMN reductase